MNRLLVLSFIVGLTLALGFGGTALAGDGCCNYGLQYQVIVPESIPYFAQFPPVYYSQPVPRPYGWSPYAYPPGVLTPEPAPVPEMTINPYVPRDSEEVPHDKAEKKATAATSIRIINPYYEASSSPQASDVSQTQ